MSRRRHAPGEYCDVRSEDGDYAPEFYVYGHLAADEYRTAVNKWHGEELIGADVEVVHLYARNVFMPDPENPGDRAWLTSSKPSRGATKVTARVVPS